MYSNFFFTLDVTLFSIPIFVLKNLSFLYLHFDPDLIELKVFFGNMWKLERLMFKYFCKTKNLDESKPFIYACILDASLEEENTWWNIQEQSFQSINQALFYSKMKITIIFCVSILTRPNVNRAVPQTAVLSSEKIKVFLHNKKMLGA